MSSRQGYNPLQHASQRAGNFESQGQAISGYPWLLSSSETCLSGPRRGQSHPFLYQCPRESPYAVPRGHHQRISVVLMQFQYPGHMHKPIGVLATGIPSGGPRPQPVLLHCCRYHYGIIQSAAGLTVHAARLSWAGSRQG